MKTEHLYMNTDIQVDVETLGNLLSHKVTQSLLSGPLTTIHSQRPVNNNPC